jgi:prevent-host-death family protein
MKRLKASEAREQFAEALNQVAYRGERIILQRRGKDLAAVIPISDLEILEKLEDQLDVEAAKKALAESDERIPYAQVRKELGLK